MNTSSSTLDALYAEKAEFEKEIAAADAILASDPQDPVGLELKAEFEKLVAETDAKIVDELARLSKPAPPSAHGPAPSQTASPNGVPMGVKQDSTPVRATGDVPTYKVNDTVMAKWKSGDRAFYAARIISITGSSTDPIYRVQFQKYTDQETLRAHEIRPYGQSADTKKRKADEPANAAPSAPPPPPPTVSPPSSSVISAAANIDPALAAQAQLNAAGKLGGVEKTRPVKKLKGSKDLQKAKNNWQSFQAKKPRKGESMFRTPDNFGARVGFTGSGQAMRKDPTRTKHKYAIDEEEP